jgi:hypothetical protein
VTFERRVIVPPERLRAVVDRAVDECRRATFQHIPLPPDERLEIDYVGELAWAALTRYEGGHKSRLIVNASAGFTVDDVLQLACHETYPGHHTMNVLVDDALVHAAHRIDLTVQLRFSPQALVAEGAASIAPQLAFSDADRLRIESTILAGVAGADPNDVGLAFRVARLLDELAAVRGDIAVRYVDGDLEFARAAAALEREALMPSPDPLLKFLNEFRTYAVTYMRGPGLATKYLDAQAAPDDRAGRWRAYVRLVTSPSQAFRK